MSDTATSPLRLRAAINPKPLGIALLLIVLGAWTLALTVAGCMLLVLTFGYAGTALALRVRPAPLLRNE